MIYYLWVFPWLLFASYISGNNQSYRMEYVPGIKGAVPRLRPRTAFIVILPIILWAGFRSFWFADTGAYYSMFQEFSTSWEGFLEYIPTITKDRVFYIASAAMKLLTSNARTYFVVVALIQGISLYKFFRRYSSDYIISLFLFIASTDIYSWMFNGLRQFVAVSITLLASFYIIEKKYVKAIIIIVFASFFHQSALLLIPFVFIVQGKAWNKKTILFLCAVIIAVVFAARFTGWLDDALEYTQYTNVVSDYTSWEDDGTNPVRVLIYSVPAILAFVGRKEITRQGETLINLCANMSIVSSGLYLISMATSGIFLGRLPIYFSLYGYILLPWEIDNLFGNNKKIIKNAMIILYLLFYYYQMHLSWGYF